MKSQRNQRCLKFPFTYSEIYAYVFLTRQQWFYGTFKTDEQIIFLITRFRAIIECDADSALSIWLNVEW